MNMDVLEGMQIKAWSPAVRQTDRQTLGETDGQTDSQQHNKDVAGNENKGGSPG